MEVNETIKCAIKDFLETEYGNKDYLMSIITTNRYLNGEVSFNIMFYGIGPLPMFLYSSFRDYMIHNYPLLKTTKRDRFKKRSDQSVDIEPYSTEYIRSVKIKKIKSKIK